MARQSSAKACTPVRIWSMPPKPSKKLEGFFVVNFLVKLIKEYEFGRNNIKPSKKVEGVFIGNF